MIVNCLLTVFNAVLLLYVDVTFDQQDVKQWVGLSIVDDRMDA